MSGTVLWVLVSVGLAVVIVRRRSESSAKADPEAAFARLQRGHELLVVLALLTVLGAVAGAHGWSPF